MTHSGFTDPAQMNLMSNGGEAAMAAPGIFKADAKPDAANQTPSLLNLLDEGVYLLFQLRNGNHPTSTEDFNTRVDQLLGQFDRHARNFAKPPESVHEAKYAICALLDEIILSTDSLIRDSWERQPLQLRLFGEHLAGEGFFDHLDKLRMQPEKNVEALEVYYYSLLLGFQGKYMLEGLEKLHYLTSQLGQEINAVRGKPAEFSPNWKLPFKFNEMLRHELPMWVFYVVLLIAAIGIYTGLALILGNKTDTVKTLIPASTQNQNISASNETPNTVHARP